MGMWSRLRKTFRGDDHLAEIQRELRFHLDMDAADGHDARQARLRLGNPTRITEETRAVGIIEWLDATIRDVRHGLRQLRRTPALTFAVLLSLTIGVGANTAIFSLIDAALLRPLPVSDPDSLRIVEWTNNTFPQGVRNINGDFRSIEGGRRQGSSVSASSYRRLAREQTAFQTLVGIADADAVAIAVAGSPAEQVNLQFVSANFFQGVGAPPVLGRPFQDEEDRVGAEPVIIVSHRFWVTRLGSASNALERSVRVNNVSARIVGIAPPGFFGLRPGEWTDVYAPLATKVAFLPRQAAGAPRAEDDSDWWVRQVGRLRPDVSEELARAQVAGLFRKIVVPEGMTADPAKVPELVSSEGRRGFGALGRMDRNALWILLLLVGVLLLIVCANVANLLLSRAVGRQRESAVRLALGAARMRLFRQHLIESGVIAVIGGAAGLVLGYALARSIHLLFQTGRNASSAFDLHVDVRVLAYTSGLSILTAILFGLAPAVRATRADLNDVLKANTRSVVGGQLRIPRLLVSIQIALCLAALMAAGLLGRSLVNLKGTDIGFDRTNLAYASVSPSRAGYSAERVGSYLDRVRQELSRVPGIVGVSPVQTRVLSSAGNFGPVHVPGRPPRIERGMLNPEDGTQLNAVGDGYFGTLRIPVLSGRTIEARDMRPNTAPVIVVDEAFARHFFPNENPVGRRVGLTLQDDNGYEIIGVVGNSRYNTLREQPSPTIYHPYRPGGTIHLAIRATLDASQLAAAVRQTVASVDPAVPVTEFHTQTGLIDRLLRTERMLGFLSAAFGVIALTLAAIGLAGLLAYAVARRTNEIGVRMALGAAATDVIRMVVRDSLSMVGMGVLLGLPCAYLIGRVLRTMLFRLEPVDPATAVFSLLTLLTVALLAAWIPARRAASIDPVVALRDE